VQQLFPDAVPRARVLPLVVGCILLSGACQAFSVPAFYSWMADLIPGRVRTSFFVRRMQLGTCIAIAASLAGGYIADTYPDINVYSTILALGGVLGVLDIALFIGVREPAPSPRPGNINVLAQAPNAPPFWASLREPLHDRAVRNFLTFVSITMLSAGLVGPFMWLHALEYWHLSKTTAGLLLTVAPLLGIVSTSRFWGQVIKRYGNRPVMRLIAVGLIVVPLHWLGVRPSESGVAELWGTFFVMTFGVGSLWAALDLTNQNLLLGLSPHIPRSTLSAVFAITTGLSFAVAAWAGGALAHWLTLRGFECEIFGVEVIKYHILFAAALVLRVVNALVIAPRLHEPAATATMDAVREMVPEMIDSFTARFRWPFSAREE
jgi:MFS family permease